MTTATVNRLTRFGQRVTAWDGWLTVIGAYTIVGTLTLAVLAVIWPGAALTGLIVYAVASHIDDIRRVRNRAHRAYRHKRTKLGAWVHAVTVEIGVTPTQRHRVWFRRMCEVLEITPAPQVLHWRETVDGEEYELRIITTATMSSSEFARRAERIRDYAGPRIMRVHVIADPHRGGRVYLRFVTKDMTAEALTDWPALETDPGTTSITDGILVGRDSTGNPVRLDVVNDAIFVAGQRGTGKSGLLQIIVAAAELAADADPIPCDLKDGAEFWMHRDKVTLYADNPTDAERIIDYLLAERPKRSKALTALGKRKWEPGCGLPFLLLVVDEVAELPKGDDSAQSKLTKLVRLGRAQGIGCVLATQRPSADWIDTSLRAQCNVAVSFRVKDAIEAGIALGAGSVGVGYEPHRLPKPGVFLVVGDDEQVPRRCRAYYLSDTDVGAFVAKLPTLVSEAATESATDPLSEPIQAGPIEGPGAADRVSATADAYPEEIDGNAHRRRLWAELVAHPGWITRGRLARLAQMSESGVSKILADWEDRGYVERSGQQWKRREHRQLHLVRYLDGDGQTTETGAASDGV